MCCQNLAYPRLSHDHFFSRAGGVDVDIINFRKRLWPDPRKRTFSPEGPCASRISIDAIMISTQAPLALGDELFAARINRLTRLSVVACQDAAWPAHVAAAAGHSIVSQWPYALRTTPHGHSTN